MYLLFDNRSTPVWSVDDHTHKTTKRCSDHGVYIHAKICMFFGNEWRINSIDIHNKYEALLVFCVLNLVKLFLYNTNDYGVHINVHMKLYMLSNQTRDFNLKVNSSLTTYNLRKQTLGNCRWSCCDTWHCCKTSCLFIIAHYTMLCYFVELLYPVFIFLITLLHPMTF